MRYHWEHLREQIGNPEKHWGKLMGTYWEHTPKRKKKSPAHPQIPKEKKN
jgi:hypothetical protein